MIDISLLLFIVVCGTAAIAYFDFIDARARRLEPGQGVVRCFCLVIV
ncbi:hypothetical protein [Caballeronia sp. ATUFL_M2_KS44]|nr:hypothetical protein [Caballeronia sp. ATUFL_M2_KS44]